MRYTKDRGGRRSLVAVTTGALVAALLLVAPVGAEADTAPPPNDPTKPTTVGANPLPTVQIGTGVVWSQVIIGNTVYVGGEFSTARPAGAAPGTQQVTRNNLLAFDIRTGVLINGWAPSTNGPVFDVTASPDGTRVYAAGNFTTVNGATQRRVVALNPTTGARITTFNPNVDGSVYGITASNTTVWYGGSFNNVGGVARGRLAASNAANGALLPWTATASGGVVRDLELSPDGTQVLVAGGFTSLNGSSNPGFGLASLDPVTAAFMPWEANNSLVRNGGINGDVLSLTSDGGDAVYATGGTYARSGGNLEGTAKMLWDGGKVVWLEDCHGDTYDALPMDGAVYTVSHKHYCGNVPGGFNQPEPWVKHPALAFTEQPTGVLRTEYNGYFNYAGTPAPSMVHWEPYMQLGNYTQSAQAAWNLVGNDDYVVAGGEFPRVGAIAQQGLVRFARPGVSGNPNNYGGEVDGSFTNPTVTSPGAGQAVVCWQSNFDRDNEFMTYEVIRNNVVNSPIATRTTPSESWDRPYQCYTDTGLAPGSTVTYRIFATDAFGNEDRSDQVPVTISGSGDFGAYGEAVAKDGPMHYWRLDDSGGTAVDATGLEDATVASGVTKGAAGAIPGHTAMTFDGSTSEIAYNQTAKPGLIHQYSVEAWFRTSTSFGGKILGFGSSQTGSSTTHDRMLYLDTSGRVNFGSRQGNSFRVLTSQSGLNNNDWHHAVGTVGVDGMALYVDGQRVGHRNDTFTGRSFNGFWRIGGDNLSSSWANNPANDWFSGSVDEVAVYAAALSGNQVREHFLASGRTLAGPAKPTDTYGATAYDSGPDAYWRLAETSGSTAADSSGNGASAGYLDNVFLGSGPTQGGVSGIGLASDRSASFDGAGDYVALNNSLPAPLTFSSELWFRTGTTSGGKLIGFGSSRTSNSSTNYDRHVFMTNAGKLRFGVQYAGTQHAIESPGAYNNNQWHHVVATFGSLGMRLFVDGALVAQGSNSGSQGYTGYWRVGGDNLSGWASRPNSDYFAGSIDEAAVYGRQLSAGEVVGHFAGGGGTPANQLPVAEFSSTPTELSVAFNSSASDDPDGTIASYSWSFGDGGNSTAANPTHVYAAGGTYTVELTVTDNDGGSDTVSHDVTVVAPPPNQPPVAEFSSTVDDLTANFNSSSSTDPDGSIVSRSWAFGDSGTSNLANPAHTYAAAGTYQVTLTVTDDDGATSSVTHPVTVNDPSGPPPLASDTFTRSLTGGWGTSDLGGPWTHSAPTSQFSVAGGVGQMTIGTPGAGPWSYLTGISAANLNGSVDVSIDKPATGGGIYHTVSLRRVGTSEYRVKVWLPSDGTVRLVTSRLVSGTQTTLGSVVVPGLTYTPGDQIRLAFTISGSGTTVITAKAWRVGTAEPPAAQLTSNDSTAGLQGAGSIAMQGYMAGSGTNAPVVATFDNLVIFPG